MPKELRWKALLILAVTIGCFVGIFGLPKSVAEISQNFQKNIKLGLDLKGGSHLVLQVQVQDAFKAEAQVAAERLKEALTKANITYTSVEVSEPKSLAEADQVKIFVRGLPNARIADFRTAANDRLGEAWQLGSSGADQILSMKSSAALQLRRDTVLRTQKTIDNRINGLGLAESSVQVRGASDLDAEILVQLPGVDDPSRIKSLIQTAALLEIVQVNGGPYPNATAAAEGNGGIIPLNSRLLPDSQGGQEVFYLVNRTPVVTGRDVRNARAGQDQMTTKAETQFTLSQEAAKRFAAFTGANIGKPLAVVLDNRIQSVATIQSQISDSGVINNQPSAQDAQDLAVVLNAGSLPAGLVYLEERTVGPSLGADSIRQGLMAGIAGLIAVIVAMLLYYKAAGINATLALLLNALILIAALAYFGATLTLPGIAGIVLTIGMAVDSNVLIFERIREELRHGKTVLQAVEIGFDKAFATIIDTHVATVVSCLFLFYFGTANVKGFAVTLTIGLIANVFTAVFVSRFIFDWTLSKEAKPQTLSI
jgi:preprotein translocase subunit SecD